MSNSLERRADGSIALFIDGGLQFDSNDERIYHEALTLPALAIAAKRLKSPLKVLIVGGGDGLVAREVFKSSAVTSVDLVDYDPEILNFARHEIADLNNNSLSDPRMTVHVEDAWAFVDQALANNIVYHAIIVDLTGAADPTTLRFHSIEWYNKLSRLLPNEGIISVNSLSPQKTPEAYWSIFNSIAKANLQARPYHINLPSFAAQGYGEDWGFFIASRQLITMNELDENLHKHFIFPAEIMAYQSTSLPATVDSHLLLDYALKSSVDTTYSGAKVNSLTLDTASLVIPEPDNGKNILPQPIRSMLAESVQEAGAAGYAQDPQLLLQNVLELMPSLQNEQTPELITDFLQNPSTFLEAIDLPALVNSLLKRAAELPAKLVAELELLRDKLQEWASDHYTLLLDLGPRVITILTLVVVVGNLLYPDAVYGKGEHGGHDGHHAAAVGRRGGRGTAGWGGGTNYTNPYYVRRAPQTIYQQRTPGQPLIQNVRPSNPGGAGRAPNATGYINDLDNTLMISQDVYLTKDNKYIAVKTENNQIIYLDGHNWYSDAGKTALNQPYPDELKTALTGHLSSVIKDGIALHSRLLKAKSEFISHAQILTKELNQFRLASDTTANFGTQTIPVAEAIKRTEAALNTLGTKMELLNKQIAQLSPHIDLTKIALANLTVLES